MNSRIWPLDGLINLENFTGGLRQKMEWLKSPLKCMHVCWNKIWREMSIFYIKLANTIFKPWGYFTVEERTISMGWNEVTMVVQRLHTNRAGAAKWTAMMVPAGTCMPWRWSEASCTDINQLLFTQAVITGSKWTTVSFRIAHSSGTPCPGASSV